MRNDFYGFSQQFDFFYYNSLGTRFIIFLVVGLAGLNWARGQDQTSSSSNSATIQELKAEVEALSKKVNSMEEQRDQESEVPQNQRLKDAAVVKAGPAGFEIQSADHQFDLQLKGLLQVQDREFLTPSTNGGAPGDGIYLRRARVMFDGTLWNAYTFRIEPEFGARTGGAGGTSSSTATLANAYFNVNYWDPLQLQLGRFKGPIGYERTQMVANNIWVENGLTQNLTPNYDQAIMLHGNIGKLFSYGVGIMEGDRDNSSEDVQVMSDNNYDFVGDIYFNPFSRSDEKALQGLGFGAAGSMGNRGSASTASSSPLATYTTPAQTNLLTYNTTGATESEDGFGFRYTPVIYYYYGPFGLYADYAVSSIRALRTVAAASRTTTLHNDAWQTVASYVLTGENADYANGVKPRDNFNLSNHTWGAFQLVARYGELTLDNNYFTSTGAVGTVNGPIASQGPHKTSNIGLGVNWYLNENIKAQFEYDYAGYSGGRWPVTSANEDQNSFMTQLQLAF